MVWCDDTVKECQLVRWQKIFCSNFSCCQCCETPFRLVPVARECWRDVPGDGGEIKIPIFICNCDCTFGIATNDNVTSGQRNAAKISNVRNGRSAQVRDDKYQRWMML